VWHPFTAWLWRVPNHLDPPAEMLLDPTLTAPRVALVHPKVLDAREVFRHSVQQQWHGGAVLNIGRVYLGAQHQAATIDQHVALAAIDAFGAVVATNAADAGRANRLAIDDACTRLRVAPDSRAELLAQDSVEVLPGAVQPPQAEIVIDGWPGRELVWQQPPSAATSNNVEDGVQDLAEGVKARSPDAVRWRQQRVQASELSVRQIGQVRTPRWQTPAILPGKPAHVPVFRQFLARNGAGAFDYGDYVRAAVAVGSSPNGVFGARVMWGTLEEIVTKLGPVYPDLAGADLELLTRASDHTRFVYLWRDDTVAQAVSWARAEQTQFWHEGDTALPRYEPRFDFKQVHALVQTINEHNAAWRDWFAAFDVQPHRVRYEALATDPAGVTRGILHFLGLHLPADRVIVSQHRRQADPINDDWIGRYRAMVS